MANKVRDFVVNSLKQFNEYLQENILPSYSNKQSDWNTSNTNDDSYIKNKPTIPPEVTESTVASWGFTKNTGSLTIETDPVFSASAAHSISANDITNWNNKVSNVQGNWNTTNPSDESYIKNKPAIPSIEGLATETYVIDKISSQSYVTSSQLSSQGYLTSFTESDPVFRNSAASVITAQNILDWNAKVSNVQADWNEDDNTEESYINNKPYIENSYFLVVDSYTTGNSTSGSLLSTKWGVSSTYISDLYDGLQIVLRTSVNSAGVTTAGAVLNINNGDYKPIVYNKNSLIGSRYSAGSTLILAYNASQTAYTYLTPNTKSLVTGCWQIMDYSNSDIYVRQYKTGNLTTANNEENAYSLLLTYSLINTDNYKAGATKYNPSYTLNPFTGELKVGQLNALDGILSYNTYSLNIPETNGTIAVKEDILDIIKDNEFVTATVLNEHDNRLIDLETAGYLIEIPNIYPTYAAISSMGYLTSFTETDPTVPTYIKNITEDNISSWNSRALSYYIYADGTKNLEVIKHLVFDLPRRNYSIVLDGLYYIQPTGQVSGSSFGNNTGWAPIIRVGIYENTSIIDLYFYTIFDKDSNNNIANNNWSISLYKTDRLTKANIESMTSIPYTLNSNSIFAFKSDLPPTITESTVAGWGFTKNTGILTEEIDPTVPSYIKNITETNISDWNNKVSKLELSGLGYITQASLDSNSYAGYSYVYAAYSYVLNTIYDNEFVTATVLNYHNDRLEVLENAGYITSFSESDPIFMASAAHDISSSDITNWNNKVSNVRGDWNESDSTSNAYILNKPELIWEIGKDGNGISYIGSAQIVDSGSFAYNTYAIAEGREAKAIGIASHSEGRLTSAYGKFSHAEGQYSISLAQASHAEGYKSYAYGAVSHAEGYSSYTFDQASHAEGFNTYAYGPASHAEGYKSYAYGINSHAEGGFTFAIGTDSHSEGEYTYAIGDTSHTEGQYTYAYGFASHAEGIYSYALGNFSHAEGIYSYAIGKSSHAGGYNSFAIGTYSFATGYNSISYGACSFAEGQYTYTKGVGSHTEGYGTYTGGDFTSNTLSDNGIDISRVENGVYAHAEGFITIAKGPASHAEGGETFASGIRSHTEGFQTEAIGKNSHAEGRGTTSIGNNSHAEGDTTVALNGSSHAEGSFTTAYGENSHAEGHYSYAIGVDSHAEGARTYTYNLSEHAQGNWNISLKTSDSFGNAGNTTFTHGIGTSASNRKNAFEVMENGNAYLINVGNYNGTNVASATPIQTIINAKTVGQNSSTANSTYNVLLKYSANNTNETNTVNYSSKLNYNPSTGMLSNTGDIRVGNGNLYIGSASESQCHQEYDATNKCLKFIFD